MAADKFTVSVDSELRERAQEAGLNVSGLLATAIERELDVRSEFNPGLVAMQLRMLADRIEGTIQNGD